MLAHRQSWNFRANPAAQTAAGDGVLRDFPVRFQQGRFKHRKADKDLAYSTLITASHSQNVSDVLLRAANSFRSHGSTKWYAWPLKPEGK